MSKKDFINASEDLEGIKENLGTNANIITRWFGLDASWCAMFVSYTAFLCDIDETIIPKTASVAEFYSFAKANDRLIAIRDIEPGDILLYEFDRNHTTWDHCGIALSRPTGGYVIAREGNTSKGNNGSQANGDGVYKRTRHTSLIRAVFRPAWEEINNMPISDADAIKIAKEVATRYGVHYQGRVIGVYEAMAIILGQLDKLGQTPNEPPR